MLCLIGYGKIVGPIFQLWMMMTTLMDDIIILMSTLMICHASSDDCF